MVAMYTCYIIIALALSSHYLLYLQEEEKRTQHRSQQTKIRKRDDGGGKRKLIKVPMDFQEEKQDFLIIMLTLFPAFTFMK